MKTLMIFKTFNTLIHQNIESIRILLKQAQKLSDLIENQDPQTKDYLEIIKESIVDELQELTNNIEKLIKLK